jgi:hypothetical protein
VQKVYKRRKGLKGPFEFPNGRVVYFDPKANEYWDPRTDFFLERDEIESLKSQIFDLVRS